MSLSTFKGDARISTRKRHKVLEHGFTAIQVQLLTYMAEGLTTPQIAREMGFRESSIETYKTRMFRQHKFKNSPHAVAFAIRSGIIK